MDGGRDGHHENCREHHTPNTSVHNNTLLGELTLAVSIFSRDLDLMIKSLFLLHICDQSQ
jgi:hypothetical protein